MNDDWLFDGGEPPPGSDEAARIAALRTLQRERTLGKLPRRASPWGGARWAVGAGVPLLVAAIALIVLWPRPSWTVRSVSGAPCEGCSLAAGESLSPPEGSTWEVALGDRGEFGAVRILGGSTLERRAGDGLPLRLVSGAIDVHTTAPAFALSVETPAATVVDLGCAFHLEADAQGTDLDVYKGAVALQTPQGISVVGGGSEATVELGKVPELPVRFDASDAFRDAAERNDATAMLALARPEDLFTLWHVLQRVPASERATVFQRMATLEPTVLPTDEAKVLALDPDALKMLWTDVANDAYLPSDPFGPY